MAGAQQLDRPGRRSAGSGIRVAWHKNVAMPRPETIERFVARV